jgi:hypothetical protein
VPHFVKGIFKEGMMKTHKYDKSGSGKNSVTKAGIHNLTE